MASAGTGSPGEADRCPEARPLVKACFLNKSFCHLKLGEYDDCIRSSTALLDIDPSDYKARYRRGVVETGPCRPPCVIDAKSPWFSRLIVQFCYLFLLRLCPFLELPSAPRDWPKANCTLCAATAARMVPLCGHLDSHAHRALGNLAALTEWARLHRRIWSAACTRGLTRGEACNWG